MKLTTRSHQASERQADPTKTMLHLDTKIPVRDTLRILCEIRQATEQNNVQVAN